MKMEGGGENENGAGQISSDGELAMSLMKGII